MRKILVYLIGFAATLAAVQAQSATPPNGNAGGATSDPSGFNGSSAGAAANRDALGALEPSQA